MEKKKYKIKKLPSYQKGGNYLPFDDNEHSNDPWGYRHSKFSTNNSKTTNISNDTTINTSIKEVDEEEANAELEKGETLYKGLDKGLFQINGKPHSEGGTDVVLDKNDFVFSKKLKLPGEVLDKEFGKFKEGKDYSIADVSKNYLKFNKFIDLANSKDNLNKFTGEKMRDAYNKKLSRLALLQEAYKGFPNGIPSISMSELGMDPNTITQGGKRDPQEAQEVNYNDVEQPQEFGLPEFQTGGQSNAKIRNNNFGTNSGNKPTSSTKAWADVYKKTDAYLKNNVEGYDQGSITTHEQYQQAIAKYGKDQLLSLFKNDQMPLTNKGKKALGIKDKGDIYVSSLLNDGKLIGPNGKTLEGADLENFLTDQFVDGLAGHRRIDFEQGTLTKEEAFNRRTTTPDKGFDNYDFLGKSDLYINETDINEGDGSVTFYYPSQNPSNVNRKPVTGSEVEEKQRLQKTNKQIQRVNIDPNTSPTVQSNYRDLGFSTPEHLTLLNNLGSMAAMPKFEPTRFQNYGLQQALGLASNVMPYNYQSAINESTRAGLQGIRANNQISPNSSIASARNAVISGGLAEQTSKIKGDEYNQNVNLYNNNQMQIANLAGQIGADKEQQGSIYVNNVNQMNENYWANQLAARNNFVANLGEAYERRGLRNTMDFYAQSKVPNYRVTNADLAAGFQPSNNPLGYINSFGNNQQQDPKHVTLEQWRAGSDEDREYWKTFNKTKQ